MDQRPGSVFDVHGRDRLPPEEVRRYDPRYDGLIETPVDERGLVDLNKLVAVAKETVEPGYMWESHQNDIHHLQWVGRHYDIAGAFSDVDTKVFRNLVNRKAYVPRLFHNWIHFVTTPSPVPSDEVMRYSIDAQRVAMSLARTAGLATKLTRRRGLSDMRLRERLDQEFENYNLYIDNAREVPTEFSLLNIEDIEAHTVDEMLDANKRLGRLALDRIPVVQRQIRQAA